jgi:diacylglycerol kinase (ATP)
MRASGVRSARMRGEGGADAREMRLDGRVQPAEIVYVVNPASGRGNAVPHDEREHVEIVTGETFRELHDRAITAIERRPRALVVQGGDGMVSLGAALVDGTGIPLGVVPTGSGNDFARSAGIPRHAPAATAQALVSGILDRTATTRAVDLLRIRLGERHAVAVNSLNIGFDARVNHVANRMRLPGTARYVAALLRSLRHYVPFTAELRLNDGEARIDPSAQVLAVANGASCGGGIRLAPAARLDSGEFELVHVRGASKLQLLTLFPIAMVGRHTGLRVVDISQARRLRARIPSGVYVYADGERLRGADDPHPLDLEVTVAPGALRLVVPAAG